MYGATVMSAALAQFLERVVEQRYDGNQREAARRMGVPVQTLNDLIINPEKVPNLLTLRKIANGVGVSIVTLIDLAGFGPVEEEAIRIVVSMGLLEESRFELLHQC